MSTPPNQFVKIEDRPDLVRDQRSNAVVSTKADVVMAAVLRKQKARDQDNDILELKNDVAEIKKMLNVLINNSNNETT